MKFAILCLSLVTFLAVKSQELIRNGSFEECVGCNGRLTRTQHPKDWLAWYSGTPDYYHVNSTIEEYRVPNNWNGFTPSHSGHAYMGLMLISDEPYYAMEHLQLDLETELIKDKTYNISAYVMMAKKISNYYCDKFEVLFDSSSIRTNKYLPDTYFDALTPKDIGTVLKCENMCPDSGWYKVNGLYKAIGGERYLSIGIFWQQDDKLNRFVTKTKQGRINKWIQRRGRRIVRNNILFRNESFSNRSGHAGLRFAYYFVDDISIYSID